MLKHRHSIHIADPSSVQNSFEEISDNPGPSTSKPDAIKQPAFSSSKSLVTQAINIKPFVQTNENDEDSSSVIDSDSDNEQNETVVASHVAAIQNRNLQNLKDLVPKMGPIKVSDSTEVTVGSKLIFEGGSSVTFVVHESKPVDLEVNRKQIDPSDCRKKEENHVSESDELFSLQRFKLLSTRRQLFYVCFVLLITTIIVAFSIAFSLINHSNIETTSTSTTSPETSTTSETSTVEESTTTTISTTTTEPIKTLPHITREQWSAKPPNGEYKFLDLPVEQVILSTTQRNGCMTQSVCIPKLKEIQTDQMNKQKLMDISYNILVANNGEIYDGRGWDPVSECLAGNYINSSICISLIGIHKHFRTPITQLDGFRDLLQEGVDLGKISTDYQIYGEEDFQTTASELYYIVESWPHWGGIV